MEREPSPALSTTSSSAATQSDNSRSTTPSSSDVSDVRAPTLTPATSFSSIAEDEDRLAPKDTTDNHVAPHAEAEGENEKLSPEVRRLKALSLSLESYSPNDNPQGCSTTCSLTRALLQDLQDYHHPKPQPKKETPSEQARRLGILAEHFTLVNGEWRCLICVDADRRPFTKSGRHELAKHLRIHLCDNHKPFKCQFPGCSRAVCQKSNMESHLRTHTCEKIPCKWCGLALNNSTAVCRHAQSCDKNPNRKPRDDPITYVAVLLQAEFEENRVRERPKFILNKITPDENVARYHKQCDLVNSFPNISWNWGMIRSTTYSFNDSIGKLRPVPSSTCVFDFKPPANF